MPGNLAEIEEEVLREWLQEAERRYQAYREGEIKSRPSDLVMQETRNKLEAR